VAGRQEEPGLAARGNSDACGGVARFAAVSQGGREEAGRLLGDPE